MAVLNKILNKDNSWKLVAAGSALLAGLAVRNLLNLSWKAINKKDPPTNPASFETTWQEAITYTIATGVAVGLARMLAERGAAAGWQKFTGSIPPGL